MTHEVCGCFSSGVCFGGSGSSCGGSRSICLSEAQSQLVSVYLITLALMLRPLILTVNVCVSSGGHQEELCSNGVTILNQDFTVALETLQDVQATAVGAPKVV